MTTTNAISPTTQLPYSALRRLLSDITGDAKHLPSATSTLDVLWVLYDKVLNVDPSDPENPRRDRFLLSKGHGPASYYAVLAAKGFIPLSWLPTIGEYDSPLGYHPDRKLVPGVEISTGSLGHGLGLAVGLAVGLRAQQNPANVVVLVGDAELDEGSNHEAIAYAARVGLDNLTAVVVDNTSSTHGWPGGIVKRFAVEGWITIDVDGRDHAQIEKAFAVKEIGRPHAVIAHVEAKRSVV